MTLKNLYSIALAFFAIIFIFSCGDDDSSEPANSNLTLNFDRLEDLGNDYNYEGWIIVDGAPVSTGTFTVDANGNLSQTSFEVETEALEAATTFVLTIEPNPDSDPAPSAVKILGGDFDGVSSSLSVTHGAALGTDFAEATGSYILATPTDGGMDTDEFSGVWWLDPAGGPAPGLDLPTLPEGWAYEGWAVVNGTPLSTGTFTSVSGADAAAPFSGSESGPAYPGEDFLNNAPAGISFPIDLKGMTVVVSVEPVPDNSAAPFLLKPLVGGVPLNATDHTLYDMDNNASSTNPSGTATR